jgi:SnoaL-like domain
MPKRSKSGVVRRKAAPGAASGNKAAPRSAAGGAATSGKASARAVTADKARIASLRRELSAQKKTLRYLADRQAILDCAVRFSRGINRRDPELLKSVFHPDAVDDHGLFVGNRDDFVSWIDTVYDRIAVTQHFVTNQTVDIEGDTAHAETYWLVANVMKGSISVVLRGGRYIDRLERRKRTWAIVERVCLIEWNCTTGELPTPPDVLAVLAQSGVSTTDRNDPSYQRPLHIRRGPQSLHAHTQHVPSQAAAAEAQDERQ